MALLLVGSGFFSGSETALFGLSQIKKTALEGRSDREAKLVLGLLKSPRRTLVTILLGNTFVNVALSALGTALAVQMVGSERGLGLSIFGVTALLLIVGEVLPKVLAVRFGEAFSLRVAPALTWFGSSVAPLVQGIQWATDGILGLFPVRDAEGQAQGDLSTLLRIGAEGGTIASGEAELVEGILALKETVTKEVMTPRVELDVLAWDPRPEDWIERIRGLRRQVLPLIGEDSDDLRGLLEVRSFLLAGEGAKVEDFLKTPFLVPETKRLADLLEDFRDLGTNQALVLDEYGGLSGLVTLEDVLEEIFGEVYDRREVAVEEIRKTPLGYWMAGSTSLDDVAEVLGCEFPDEEEDGVTTLAGFLMGQLGKVARRQDRVDHAQWRFEIAGVIRRRVVSVMVTSLERGGFEEAT